MRRLERAGCRPVEVAPERWVALCPCCGELELVVQRGGTGSAPTAAERDAWLEARGAAA